MTIAAPQTRPSLFQIFLGLFTYQPVGAVETTIRDSEEAADYQQSLANAVENVEAQMDRQQRARAFFEVWASAKIMTGGCH